MESNTSESSPIRISNRNRLKLFYKLYKKSILFFIIPLLFLPVVSIGNNNAYICFYGFIVTSAYWIFEVLHPALISLIPIVLSTLINYSGYEIMNFIFIRNALIDCFGILMLMAAMENCDLHKRIALKMLIIFGCPHYRLSFLIFFTTMLLSMCISNTMACAFMMPLVKAIIMELEKMGILDVYEMTGKVDIHEHHDTTSLKPTDFTMFYFLGIAYSSSIGGMATMVGSHTIQMLKIFCEILFPLGPKLEFPQLMLLTLPGVLILETLLYLWMNFYFLGLFRIHNYSVLQTGSTEEEEQYVNVLLNLQYQKMGKVTVNELIVGTTVVLCGILQMTTSTYFCTHNFSHIQISSPAILCAVILLVTPTNLEFLKFCRKRSSSLNDPLPSAPSKPCLSWKIIKNEIPWSVLFVIGGSCTMVDALKQSKMTDEFEKFLQIFDSWSPHIQVLVVVLFCKVLTEFGSNSSVAYCMLMHVANVYATVHTSRTRACSPPDDKWLLQPVTSVTSVASKVNPHYLMLAAALGCSLPFHMITGTPAYAMVSVCYHIPQRIMIHTGVGPSLFSVGVIWFTVALWSKAIWTDFGNYPHWANSSIVTMV